MDAMETKIMREAQSRLEESVARGRERIEELSASLAAVTAERDMLREALVQVQRNATLNRVWGGEKWVYAGLSEVGQRKIVKVCEAALRPGSGEEG